MEEAGVRLVAEGATQFNQQLDRAAKGVDDFGRNASGAAGGIDIMSVATVALGSALGELAVRGLEAASNAITGFIKSGFDYNKSIENATAQLVAFTGSQEAAAEALELVERKAAATPFAFDEMAQSAASLAATSRSTGASLEELLDLATRLAASNPAEGLEGAAFALREAFSGDFMSLQERFNISKDTVARLKEMGVTTENLSSVFNELGITTGLVSGLAETFDGRMSTLIDTVTKLAGAFTAPIFDLFSGWIADIQVGLDGNIAAWQTWATNLGQTVADAFQTAQEAWTGNWEDSEIIQPVHRLVGNATLAIKGMWDKIALFGEEKLPTIQATWDRLIFKVGDVKKAWGPLNDLLATGELLFDSLGRLGQALMDVMFGIDVKTDGANKQFGRANTLGETLAGIFERIASAVNAISAVIDAVAAGLERAAAAGGFDFNPNTSGTPPMDTGNGPTNGGIDNSPLPGGVVGQNPTPIPPVKRSSSPRGGMGGAIINRNNTVINPQIIIPAGVSASTASKIVTDGVLAAQRSRGMA